MENNTKDIKLDTKGIDKTKLINTTTKEIIDRDTNPNPVLTPAEKKKMKKNRIIAIVVMSILLVIAIVATVLAWTLKK